MPTYQVDVGDKTYEVDAPDPNTAWQWANYTHTQPVKPPPTFMEGLKGAATRGLEAVPESIAGVGLGIKSALGMESAGTQAAAIREEAKKPQVPGTSWESIEQAYEKEGLLSALKKAPSFVGEKILESAPSMAVPLAAGAAAGAVSGPFAPVVAPLAGIGTYGVQQFGQFMRRQAEEGATGETLAPGKAAAAAAVTAPIGYFADRFTLGLSKLPTKAIGNEIAAELAKRTSGVAGRAVKGATLGIVAEAPTEVLEQAAERWQAGLSLTNEDAKKEYKEAFFGAAAIGGVGGAASRVMQGAPKVEAPVKPPAVEPEAPTYKAAPSLTGTDAATMLEEQAKGTAGTDLLAGARERRADVYQPAPSLTGADTSGMMQGAPTAGAELLSAAREQQAEQAKAQQEQQAQEQKQQVAAQEQARQMPGMTGTDTTSNQLIVLQRERQQLEEAAAEKAKEIEYRKILATTYSTDPLQNFRQQQSAIERLDYTTPEVKAQEPAMTEQLLELSREDEKTAPEQKRSETFQIAPPSEVAPITKPVVTETEPEPFVEAAPIEGEPMPKSIDQIETEKRADEQVEPIQKYVSELTKKPMNLWNVLRGRLSASDVSDISPNFKYMALRQPAKKGGGTDLSELVQSGQLDEFLPPAMRMSMQDPNEVVDETDAVEYIKEKLRGTGEDYYTYDTQVALKQAFGSIEEAENAVREFLRIEDANELLAEAAAEQRAIDKEAEIAAAKGEDRTAAESVQEGLTAPTPESLKAADERAAAEEKRLAAEKKAADEKAKADAEVGEFTLTGSNRPADVAEAAGQKPMFSLRGKPEGQLQVFEQTLRTLLNKFGLKDIGLKLSEGMRDEGSYAAKLIQIAADSANPIRTLRHESVHALRELGFFTEAQWKSLSKMAKDKWIDQYLKQRNIDGKPLKAGEESRYDAYMREYKGDMEKITEEAVADAFADFDTKPPAGMIQAIIQKLRNLFQSIKSALTKMESAEQIFGKVEKGALKPEGEKVKGEAKSLRDRATANFKRWFGDSKVVDENGEPLVVYHGTANDITKFDDRSIYEGGIYFTANPRYAGGRARIAQGMGKGESQNVMPVYVRIEKPAPSSMSVAQAKAEGYDGIIRDNEVVAFKPTQIKSAIGNNGDYSLTDADIRKSLRTASPKEEALSYLSAMGRTAEKPDDSYKAKVQQAWNNAKDNPATTAKAIKDTLTNWFDTAQTWAFSSDAALNNNLRRAVDDSAKTDPERLAFLLNTSLSQTVHADALANLFITEGNLKYNKDLHKWEAVKDKDNLISLVKNLEKVAAKYDLTQEQAQLIGHTAFEAKRLKSLVEFNNQVEQEVIDMRAEAAQLRKAGKGQAAEALYSKANKRKTETKYIHMTDEEIANGNKLFETMPELKDLVSTWNGIRTNTVKILVDTGLWSEADAEFLLSNADYVPFFREDQLENGKGPKEFISGLQVQAKDRKRLKGTDKPVNDIFDNMVRWTQYSINRGVRNRSAVALADAAQEMGMARKVPARAGNDNVVRVWKNGEEVLYSMDDPMFIPAFTGLESIAIPSWKILSKFANMLRQSVVMYPLFSISQVPQDAFAAMFTSGLKPQYALRIPALAVKEFVKTLTSKSKTHEELRKFGTVGVRDFTADIARIDAEVLAGLKSEPGLIGKVKGMLQHIAMASDNAVRQATYEAAMSQGMSQSEALEKAFEVWNVRRKGSSQTLALAGQVIPFFNAYLAAQSVLVNTITGKGTSPQRKAEAYKNLAGTTASVMTLSLIYAMLNGDDEDYENKPAVQRDRLLMIPGSGGMSIPLRADLYTMPKVITEHTYLLLTDKGSEDGRKFRDSMKASLASALLSPTTVPQALKPLVEVGINYDFFTGRPIVGQFQKKLEVERQFNDSTSELAKVLGNTGLISPLNADQMIKGMFGSVGGLVLYATNPILHSDPDVERPTLSAREMMATLPGTSGFITREAQSGLKNDFYVLRDEVAKVASTIADMKARSPEKLEEYLSSEDVIARYGMSKAVNKMVEQLGKVRKQITQITNLPSDAMSGEEKQDQIKQLRDIEKDMLKSINVKELRAAANL